MMQKRDKAMFGLEILVFLIVGMVMVTLVLL